MDFIYYIMAGGLVGVTIGLTGVGGGSLMTPLLILLGFPYNVAIGTDLLYAAITKSSAMFGHARKKTVEWHAVRWLAAGSIPASLITLLLLQQTYQDATEYHVILTRSLGVMLVLTSLVLLFNRPARAVDLAQAASDEARSHSTSKPILFASGAFLGVFVTLSSVGAGALCAAILMWIYPRLPALRILGTDISHAVPLTLVAGIGHLLLLGNVDLTLLACLLMGSLPAIHFSTQLASKMPADLLKKCIASMLLLMGLKFVLF